MMREVDRRRATGLGLLLGGLLVLGLWAFLSGVVPLLLLGIAGVLAWKWSMAGAAASFVSAGALFWLGMTVGWMAWAVGIALLGTGIVLVAWPSRNRAPQDTGSE